jgi:tRNA (cytidine/uridine-2'-O-)-methyltransferase
VLVFGRESRGLPTEFCARWVDRQLRIPTSSNVRSLNLANAVGIVTWEALRQLDWPGESPMPS